MFTKTISDVRIANSYTPVNIPIDGTNVRVDFSLASINYFSIPISIILYVNVQNINNASNDCFKIKWPNTDRYIPSFDKPIISNKQFLAFDLTDIIMDNSYARIAMYCYLINGSGAIFQAIGQDSYIEVECVEPFDYLNKQEKLALSVGSSCQYSQDVISFYPNFYKKIFNDYLPYQYSLVFDYYEPSESYFSFFPNGWKLNILERIIDDGNIVLIDESFNRHRFAYSLLDDVYYDSMGTGFLLKKQNNSGVITYKLFSPINDAYKIFDASGFLTLIKLENQQEISISYTSTTITISDFLSNTITINKVSNNSIVISCNHLSQVYTLLIDDGELSSLSFTSINNTVVADYFYYHEDYHYLDNVETFDNYQLSLSEYPGVFGIDVYFNSVSTNSYSLTRFPGKKIQAVNQIKNTTTRYYFDESFNIILSNKDTEVITKNDNINYTDGWLSFSAIRASMYNSYHLPMFNNEYSDELIINSVSSTYSTLHTAQFTASRNQMLLLLFKIDNCLQYPAEHDEQRGLTIYLDDENGSFNQYMPLKTINHHGECYHALIFKVECSSSTRPVSFTFATKNNVGFVEVSDFYIFPLTKTVSSLLIQTSSMNYDLQIENNYFKNVFEIKHIGYNLFNDDIDYNSLILQKYGFSKYFYVNHLTVMIPYSSILPNRNISVNGSSMIVTFENSVFRNIFRANEDYFITSQIVYNDSDSYRINYISYLTSENSYSSAYSIIDYHGNVLISCDFHGVVTTNTYGNDLNLTSSVLSSLANKTITSTFSYDSYHRLIGTTTPFSVSNSYQYDNNYLLAIKSQTIGGSTTKYSYSTNYETLLNAYNSTYIYTKSEYGLSRLLRAYNSVDDFRFSYDSRNRLSGVGIYTSSLNTILTTTISENQNTTIINSYFGITKTLIYNSYNQLISINYNPPNNNSENVSLTYDSDKRLSSITDTCGYSNETISYSYNNYGQLFSVNRSSYANLTISYIYNDFGEVQSRQELNSGSSNSEILKYKIVSSFIRDANTRDLLSSSIVISEKSTLGTYIPVFTLLNAKTFDDLYRLNSITTKIGTYGVGFSLIEYKDGTNNTTSHQIKKITYQNNGDVSYTYDGNGNIKTISDSFVDNSTKQYSYDSRGQLITEKDLMEETTTTYSYDYNGNITSIVKKQTYYPKATLESHSFTYSKTVLNLLVAYDNQAISYDNNYNPTSLNGATLTYYRGNKLYSYFKSGVSTQYRYNGFGIRTYKQVASTTHHYILDNERILKEVLVTSASTKVINYIYDLSGVAGFVYNDNLYLYQKNLLDDIIAIYQVTSSSSTLVAKYKYDPYGNHQVFNPDGTLNTTPSFIGHINPFRYRSYYFDEESGFYYCQTRYYVPYLRRWLTMDDLSYLDNTSSNGLNLFMYCHNNPIMYKDETGQLPIIISMALIGIAVGAASYAFSECISAAITGEWSWSWGQFGGSIFGGAIGGIFSALGAGICLTGFVTGFFSTATGMLLQNGFGEANYSFNSIMTFSIFTGVLSALAAKATDYIRIPRINAGKNSFGAITKSIITKQNGSISSISIKTASKSLIYVMYGSLLSTIMSGIMDAQAQSNESDEFYFLINNSFY